ncbi:hypothetical protein [Nocardioides pocheonensis]|jgi:hypothetical protein|uniref:hypothetical protein n=1 Tax=Nocardioides pocheonensis TaxID=661485 RepID=UPI0011CE56C0|nr:hypothetical protein [Nocardioides pocheonensis]
MTDTNGECCDVLAFHASDAALTPGQWPVETETSLIEPGKRPLTADQLLKRLEAVRRNLAIRWCGSQGAFAGYERLRVDTTATPDAGSVTFSARLIKASPTSHTVALLARAEPDAATGSWTVLVEGEGRTLHVRTSTDAAIESSTHIPTKKDPS